MTTFRSRESLQEDHRRAAARAMPKRVFAETGSCFCSGGAGKRCEQSTAKRYSSSAEAVGEKSEMTDAHERFGQHMQEEAAQELASPELHLTLLATVGVVFPAEVTCSLSNEDALLPVILEQAIRIERGLVSGAPTILN